MIVQTRSKPAEVVRLKFSDGLSLEETPLDVALQISKLVVNRFAARSMLIWSLSSSFMFRAPLVRSKFILADIKNGHIGLYLILSTHFWFKIYFCWLRNFETVVYIWAYLFHSKFIFANILSYHKSVKQAVFSIKFVLIHLVSFPLSSRVHNKAMDSTWIKKNSSSDKLRIIQTGSQ